MNQDEDRTSASLMLLRVREALWDEIRLIEGKAIMTHNLLSFPTRNAIYWYKRRSL